MQPPFARRLHSPVNVFSASSLPRVNGVHQFAAVIVNHSATSDTSLVAADGYNAPPDAAGKKIRFTTEHQQAVHLLTFKSGVFVGQESYFLYSVPFDDVNHDFAMPAGTKKGVQLALSG